MTRLYAILILACPPGGAAFATETSPPASDLVHAAVAQLRAMQEADGAWPYEGVYRVAGQIPVGYRIGGTALACEALLASGWPDDAGRAAFDRGIDFILQALNDPLMAPSTENRYDVRVWGQAYALDLFCRLRTRQPADPRAAELDRWIGTLTATLVAEELPGGGWNYANRRQHAAFVTAPVLQALLRARARGQPVPADLLQRGRDVLLTSRLPDGAFHYSGVTTDTRPRSSRASDAGSAARSPVCEATLMLLGAGSTAGLSRALDNFHRNWQALETRRKKTGTHAPPHGIAPYYFYFGHRYAAQVIELLPPAQRAAERARLLARILQTRDPDGTWNDRVFARSRNYGTAMVVLALLEDRAGAPASGEPPATARPSTPQAAP